MNGTYTLRITSPLSGTFEGFETAEDAIEFFHFVAPDFRTKDEVTVVGDVYLIIPIHGEIGEA